MLERGLCVFGLVLAACGGGGPPMTSAPRGLDPTIEGWLPQNRERIDAMLRALGRGSASYDPARPPVATFDWDNTIMRNDIGDATVSFMLRHDEILQPPGRDWSGTNRALTSAAISALNAACDALAEPGQRLPTSTNARCADTIFGIYTDARTPSGEPAFNDETTPTMHQPYAWGAQLLAGRSRDDARAIARRALDEGHVRPIGATITVGSRRNVPGWLRIYEPMRDLIGALRSAGFDVWVISASAQPLVEEAASRVGIPADHVVGVRTLVGPSGTLGYRLAGCGTERDGADTVITYDRGKRCWINREIFRLPEFEQLERASDPRMRAVFAAGDSDTDVAMLQDATYLKLVIDRQRVALMCNALNDRSGRWLVQPMFISPAEPRSEPYPCSTAHDALGGPLLDENGGLLVDVAGAR